MKAVDANGMGQRENKDQVNDDIDISSLEIGPPTLSPSRSVALESEQEKKGDILFEDGKYSEALAIFQVLLEDLDSDEKNIFLCFKGAACYEALEMWKELLEIATEIIEMEIGRPEGYEFGGLALYKIGHLEAAQSIIMKGLRARQMDREHKLLLLERLVEVDEALLLKEKEARTKAEANLQAAEDFANSNPPELGPSWSTQNIFECPICINIMMDPVSLHCGHSGCQKCLQEYYDPSANPVQDKCALCRADIPREQRRNLKVNVTLQAALYVT